ncbi:hypothetical protein ABEG10_25180 [Burkholderia cenocepacia]|uniref:hypothetical protein n=1 Tax=Burkholderia cenocepacia TaxID=95486 RepID=UPI0020A0FA63|nr:hypothetical protein [Burkholderia cenocepacia]MCO8364122.1 hypothetical protein [Burkholderia cenocepacia]MCO8375874.1 hypothetical protein [Burkholderia cenocepacia]MCO8389181.1 hypothetical protein [Burkholderia cenocepacia]MCO8396550.1 hypothetical protein [Burkholderia cenocepacia]MCO8410363.1 hypothetical protein [Burkholderia cenocepacia]
MKLIFSMLAAISMSAAHAFTIPDQCIADPDGFAKVPECRQAYRNEINRIAENPTYYKQLLGYRKENGFKDPCEGKKQQCWRE